MEGIETVTITNCVQKVSMSVGAPTWRGLKLSAPAKCPHMRAHVSRCPDMEGIETKRLLAEFHQCPMSVGAPTCRGLKLSCCTREGRFIMSVGAPTWRGLKLLFK